MIEVEKPKETKDVYTSTEIQNISAFGDVLRQIRARLIGEGVSIEEKRGELLRQTRKGYVLKYKRYDAQRTKRKTI